MPDPTKPTYANFPERELKVVLGAHINATLLKALRRESIGTYEMSVIQQERGKVTCDAARAGINQLAREMGLKAESHETRDYLIAYSASNAQHRFQMWVTTPFESGQAAHLLWTKYSELEADKDGNKKVGIAFKLATGFTSDDMLNQLKAAQKNAQVIEEGKPYELKGNPPPRFQKKQPAAAAPAEGAKAEGEAASAEPEAT
ncbi:MAG TPA: hypothetical protein VEL07_11935 [Planctomycetota bacterium]|nr:hypothetical protein [Planctomycetota bacterium]